MMRNVFALTVLVVSLAVVVPAMAGVEYNFESGTQGWTAGVGVANGMSNFRAMDGILSFDYVTPTGAFDPMIVSPAISEDSAVNHWLLLEVNITSSTNDPVVFQVFWSSSVGGYIEARSRVFFVTPNAGWQTIRFDMIPGQSGREGWTGTITGFRVDPGNNPTPLASHRCEFERIMLTSDTDKDGIADDTEIVLFGNITTASATSDYDGDGITDVKEIEFGLDPLTDEGVELPATNIADLVFMTICCAALGTMGIRRRATTRV